MTTPQNRFIIGERNVMCVFCSRVHLAAVLGQTTGTLRNYDGDDKENVKKAIGLISKKQQLTCITLFCTFLCCPCTTTTWNDQILSLLGNGNGKVINSTISVWTRARSPIFSSNQNSLLLSNKANWVITKKFKRMRSLLFKERFHGRCRCRIVRFLIGRGETNEIRETKKITHRYGDDFNWSKVKNYLLLVR